MIRPQRAKMMSVASLLELCEEARAYLDNDADVGRWVLAPLPNLRGSSPARWLQSRGRSGLRELTYGMVDWMPKLPEADLEPLPDDDLDEALRVAARTDEGVREFERMLAALR